MSEKSTKRTYWMLATIIVGAITAGALGTWMLIDPPLDATRWAMIAEWSWQQVAVACAMILGIAILLK